MAILDDLEAERPDRALERASELRILLGELPAGDVRAIGRLRLWQVERLVGNGDALMPEAHPEVRLSAAVEVQYRLEHMAVIEASDPAQAFGGTSSIATVAAGKRVVPLWLQTEVLSYFFRRASRLGIWEANVGVRPPRFFDPVASDASAELGLDRAERRRLGSALAKYGRAHWCLNRLMAALPAVSAARQRLVLRDLERLTDELVVTRSALELGRVMSRGQRGVLDLADIQRARSAILRAGPFRFVGRI